jgi:hypothetical protein
VTGPEAFRLKAEPKPRRDFGTVKPNIQSLAAFALPYSMAFSGFFVNAERTRPGRGSEIEDVFDGINQLPGDMLLLGTNEIGGCQHRITQGQKLMYASRKDMGVRFAGGRHTGRLKMGSFFQAFSLRAIDSEMMSAASILAWVSVH